MSETPSPFGPMFFAVYEALPRQGPGNRVSAERALAYCRDLPASPDVLDLGCGVGGQTLHVAALTGGRIMAVDLHVPSVARLRRTVVEQSVPRRITPLIADMAQLPFCDGSFDLIWSEGALYNIGIENALRGCASLLRPGGYIAFTDAVWRKPDRPHEVQAMFDADYPAMGWTADVVDAIARSGFELLGHFTVPDEAWWDDFYTPMQRRIEELREAHRGDAEALAALDEVAREPEAHREHSEYYAYEFFVARRRVIGPSSR